MSRFSELNMYPVSASGNISGVDSEVSFDMQNQLLNLAGHFRETGQGDFDVRVIKYNRAERMFTVRTLAGHPLAGYRLWRVKEVGGDVIVETFSVEHAATFMDSFKRYAGGLSGMYATWTNMLNDLVAFSQGDVLPGADTVLEGEERPQDLEQNYSHVRIED